MDGLIICTLENGVFYAPESTVARQFKVLYYYDQSFTILEIFHSEMAECFSFD